MAKPALSVVSGDSIVKTKAYKPALDDDEIEGQLRNDVEDAVDYMAEAFSENWEDAQDYFDGESSVEKVKGRSQVVVTSVRNALRGIKPSVMRVFTSGRKIVEYLPNSRVAGALAHAQTLYVNQLFWENNGYRIISDLFDDAGLKRIGAVHWYWDENPVPCYASLSFLSPQEYQELVTNEDITILSESYHFENVTGPDGQPSQVEFYDCEVSYIENRGRIVIETIPLPNFFISKNATDALDARVVGFRKPMRIGDAVRMGISEDDLVELDDYDPETDGANSGESERRRRVQKEKETPDVDVTMRNVLITVVYSRYDLDGVGVPQLWKFILGGTEYKILKKERADEPAVCVVNIETRPHTVCGGSIYDILAQDQDTQTSVLRSILDNLHGANNRRLVVNDSLVNMPDVLSQTLNAPIRTRTAPQAAISELGYTPTTGASMPLLQYLQLMSDNRVGVSQASTGLDPDALQSTDKAAVQNTINLMQGQVELICRNMAETMIPLFRGLLKLAMRHKSRYQDVATAGATFPIDQKALKPDLLMIPKVGLGTDSVTQQQAGLQFVLTQQLGAMDKLGPANPMCNMSHISNTLEDILRLANLNNPDRYFAPIDAQTGQKLAEEAAKAAQIAQQKAEQVPDPQTTLLQAEGIKGQTAQNIARIKALADARAKSLEMQFNAAQEVARDDLERDKMAQEKYLTIAELVGKFGIQPAFDRAEAQIAAEQAAERATDATD